MKIFYSAYDNVLIIPINPSRSFKSQTWSIVLTTHDVF